MQKKSRGCLFAVLFLIGFSSQAETTSFPATSFELKDASGQTQKFNEWKDKTVILDFWATWCKSCKKSWNDLKSIERKYQKQGLVVRGITLDSKNEEVLDFAKHMGLGANLFLMDTDSVAEKFKVESVPTSLIVSNGQVVYRHDGPLYVGQTEFLEHLEKALKENQKSI